MFVNCKKGFTLLELLVVVLIIGILASIALPQYRMAVLKSRFATVKQNTKTLWEANQRYYMINSSYTTNINDLDIQVASSDKFQYWLTNSGIANGAYSVKSNTSAIGYYIYGHGKVLCTFGSNDTSIFDMFDKLCKQETNGGRRGCSTSTNCYYYYNLKP